MNRESAWRATWRLVQPWTLTIDRLPSADVLRKMTFVAARQATKGTSMSVSEVESVSRDVAKYLAQHFNPKKRRKAESKSTREDRAKRDLEICQAHIAAQLAGTPKSSRELAAELACSGSMVTRALSKFGTRAGSTKPRVRTSAPVTFLIGLIDYLLPVKGRFVIDRSSVEEAVILLCGPQGEMNTSLRFACDQVSKRHPGYGVVLLSDRLLITRHHKTAELEARSWARTKTPVAMRARVGLLLCQPNLVFQDLCMVMEIAAGSLDETTWRHFVKITVAPSSARDEQKGDVSQHYLYGDPDAIFRRITKAFRLRLDSPLDALASFASQDDPIRPTLIGLASLAKLMQEKERFSDAVRLWVDVSNYRQRIERKAVLARNGSDIETFFSKLEDFDDLSDAFALSVPDFYELLNPNPCGIVKNLPFLTRGTEGITDIDDLSEDDLEDEDPSPRRSEDPEAAYGWYSQEGYIPRWEDVIGDEYEEE